MCIRCGTERDYTILIRFLILKKTYTARRTRSGRRPGLTFVLGGNVLLDFGRVRFAGRRHRIRHLRYGHRRGQRPHDRGERVHGVSRVRGLLANGVSLAAYE